MRTDPMTSVRTTMVNSEEEQASAVPHVVRRGMKQGVIGSPRSDKHKVLAVARAPKEPFWKWPGVDPLNAFQSLVSYCHTAKQADLPHAFMCLLGFHTGAQGIHLVIIAMSIECTHPVCVIGLPTACIVKSASGGGSLREGNHPPASSCKNCPRMTCREANTLRLKTSVKSWRTRSYGWSCQGSPSDSAVTATASKQGMNHAIWLLAALPWSAAQA